MNELEELNLEIIIWIIFIILSAIKIYGDNIQQLFLIENNPKYEKKAQYLFTFTITISIILYLYFVYRNYNKFQESICNHNSLLPGIRLLGSIFIVIGVFFILYYQINEETPLGTPAA